MLRCLRFGGFVRTIRSEVCLRFPRKHFATVSAWLRMRQATGAIAMRRQHDIRDTQRHMTDKMAGIDFSSIKKNR